MRRLWLLALALLITAGCGGGSTPTASTPSPAPSATFTMSAMNGSGVSGTGAIYKQVGAFKVTVMLTGLVPNSSHASHVHVGSCEAQGAVAYALLVVVADSAGRATATSTVSEDYTLARAGWYVNVHLGTDMKDAEYVPSVSCGNMPA